MSLLKRFQRFMGVGLQASHDAPYAPTGEPARGFLQGECNRCGLCCTVDDPEHGLLVCENLRAVTTPGAVPILGLAFASRCAVYERRVDGMTIKLLDGHGIPRRIGGCAKDTTLEEARIMARGIGKGCSLTVERALVPAATEIRPDGTVVRNEPLFIPTGKVEG